MASLNDTSLGSELYDAGVEEFSHSLTVALLNEAGSVIDRFSLRGSRAAIAYVRNCGRIAATLVGPGGAPFGTVNPRRSANPFD